MATQTKTKKTPASAAADAKVFNTQGKEVGTIAVPAEIFGLPWNADLVHQVVVSMASTARTGSAHTKDRGEVRGGGRKPWQQKGTGRARHGSSRSPIWKGGGVTHGPRSNKNYARKINRNVRHKALLVALSRKYRDGEVTFVDSLAFAAPKAKEARGVLAALNVSRRNNAALVVLAHKTPAAYKSFRNFGNIGVEDLRNLNAAVVLGKQRVIIENPAAAIEALSKLA